MNSSVMSMCICENKLTMVPIPWSLKKKAKKKKKSVLLTNLRKKKKLWAV